MKFFRCKHPLSSLVVEKEQTVKREDDEWLTVTYHFFCNKCGEKVDKRHARFTGELKPKTYRSIV